MKAWLLLVALMGTPMAVTAQATMSPPTLRQITPSHVTPDVLKTIVKALKKGDVPTLAHLYEHPPNLATRALAAMSLERIHFHLAKATRDAKICENALIDSQPNIAFFCAKFANGDLRLAGQAHTADLAELDIARRFAGKVPTVKLDEMRRYVARQMQIPPLQVHRPDGTFAIPLHQTARGDRYTLTIEANGTSLPLVVDTGSSYIALDATWARKLGVHMTGHSGSVSGFLAHGVHVRYGTLDEVHFGDVTMKHVPVEVFSGRHRLIGIQILRHLGAFRMSRDKITVYGKDAKLPTCRQPMLIASNVWGDSLRLLTAVRIDGMLYTPLIDSGSGGAFLRATHAALSKLKSVRNRIRTLGDIGGKHHTVMGQTIAVAVIGRQPFRTRIEMLKQSHIPWDYVLGSSALYFMDFYFNFNTHHTCMLLHHNLH